MSHTIAQLRDSVQGLLTGINLNNVVNLNICFERAARILVAKVPCPRFAQRPSLPQIILVP